MSRAPYLLDTSVVLHLARGKELGRRIMAQFGLHDAVYRPLISIVSVGELMAFIAYKGWGEGRRRPLEGMLAALVIVDINNQSVLDAYTELYAVARRAGNAIYKKNDLWIAATAKAAGAVLLTTDRDFLVFQPADVAVQYIGPDLSAPAREAAP
jgi:predicted nucleic acid-binding protein